MSLVAAETSQPCAKPKWCSRKPDIVDADLVSEFDCYDVCSGTLGLRVAQVRQEGGR